MLILLASLIGALAQLPTPSVDGQQLVSCSTAGELQTSLAAARGFGRMGLSLRQLFASDSVDLSAPMWMVGQGHGKTRLFALSLGLAPGADPAALARLLPDDGSYTLDQSRMHISWALPDPAPTGALATLGPLSATQGCAFVNAAEAPQASAVVVRANGQAIDAYLDEEVFRRGLMELHLPERPMAVPDHGPSAATKLGMVVAVRWNIQHSTKDISKFIEDLGLGRLELGHTDLKPGTQIGLAGRPSDPIVALTLRTAKGRLAKGIVKEALAQAKAAGRPYRADGKAWILSTGSDHELWLRIDGPDVHLASTASLSADVADASTGQPWFAAMPGDGPTVSQVAGVVVHLHEDGERVAMVFRRTETGQPLLRVWGKSALRLISQF